MYPLDIMIKRIVYQVGSDRREIMCSETFLNLNNEKKERIIHAALTEFSKRPFSEASITNIVKNAKISRGSFYQYFGNKEKVYEFLVSYLYNKHREDLLKILISKSGNLYEALMEFYDEYIDEIVQSEYFAFYKNTFVYVNHHLVGQEGIFNLSNQDLSRKEQQVKFSNAINTNNLKTESNLEVLEYIYFIVNTIHHMVIDGFVNDLSLEDIKKRSFRAVEWLYYGIQNGNKVGE